jgi:hypothetical protein
VRKRTGFFIALASGACSCKPRVRKKPIRAERVRVSGSKASHIRTRKAAEQPSNTTPATTRNPVRKRTGFFIALASGACSCKPRVRKKPIRAKRVRVPGSKASPNSGTRAHPPAAERAILSPLPNRYSFFHHIKIYYGKEKSTNPYPGNSCHQ